MSKRKQRPRAARREQARANDALANTRERIARLEPGGAAEWPIVVESAVLIERRAAEFSCTQCGGELELNDHVAKVVGEHRRRVVKATCRRCASPRAIWFAIVEALEN